MRGERYQNVMAVLLTVLVVASVPLILTVPGAWFLWMPLLAALALLPSVFLREADLLTGLRAPHEAREALAADLRGAGFSVTLEPDGVWARVDALCAVRFRARITDRATALSYQTRATPAGWALVIALVASVVGSLPAFVAILVLFRRAARFARAHAASAFQGPGPPSPSGADELRSMLAGSLSAGLRIAREALEAQRKAYTDAQAIVTIGAFTAWTTLLIGLFVALNGFNVATGRWEVPIVGATGGALALGGVLLAALRRRFVPRIARYRMWTDRLGDAFGRELSGSRAEPPAATSTFEILMDASAQVPDWLDAQRRAGLSGDPATAFLILILTALSTSALMNAVLNALRGGLDIVPAYGAAGVLFAGIAAFVYRRWKRREDARLARSEAGWDAHAKSLRARMDRFLEEM